MGIREQLREKPAIGYGVGGVLILIAALALTRMYWPEKRADLSQALYTDDDGQTWFADSAFKVAPFDHNGKPAVVAHVFSYANGKKKFCGYMAKFTPDAKKKLDDAIAAATAKGEHPASVSLWRDPAFMQTGIVVKKPGANGNWMLYGDPAAVDVMTVKSPDGSELDEVLVY